MPSQCWCGDGDIDKHGAGVCDMQCGGGEGACGGYFTATTYGFTDEVDLIPEEVPGTTYLGCYKDEHDDRVMTLKEKSDDTTAKVFFR